MKNIAAKLAKQIGLSVTAKIVIGTTIALATVRIGPNDPLFARQWSLNNDGTQTVQIDVDDLHTLEQKGRAGVDIGLLASQAEITAGAKAPVTVAVIDYGVDPTHPDLAGRLTADGWNFVDNSSNMYDENGHGTHVSGIIAANSNNGIGIAGIAPPSVKVMPLKVLADGYAHFAYKGQFISSYTAQAVRYATAHGASVINLSLGWPKLVDSQDARNAFAEAVAKGVLIVVSAGNDKKDKPAYPCAYPDVLCVGSVSNTGDASVFTNSGGAVDLLAPGDGIISTIPLAVESDTLRIQGYEMLSGTSQSAPHIAAMAAILKSMSPAMGAEEIKARLMLSGLKTARPGLALFGLAQLPAAIHAKIQPVYVPDFKSLEGVTVDESSLVVSDHLTVKNIWQAASNVRAQLTVNGTSAGSVSVPELASGQTFEIPWQYRFTSLDDSAELSIGVTITDGGGQSMTFQSATVAARAMDTISERTVIDVPPSVAAAKDWMSSDGFGHRFSTLSSVATYGVDQGLPIYYRTMAQDANGVSLQIFDTSKPSVSLASSLKIPYINRVTQVMKLDVLRNGSLDWVVTGIGVDANKKSFFQFYFLGPNFKPLFAKGSAWQVTPADDSQSKNIPHLYSKPDSWILAGNGHLVPSFIASGPLPALDDFDSLDPRHTATANHLYYILPDATQPAKGAAQVAVLRAVDGSSFYQQHPLGKIINPIPQSAADLRAGRVSALFAEGEDLSSKMSLLTAKNSTGLQLTAKPDWSLDLATGLLIPSITLDANSRSAVILTFTDSGRGSLTWTQPTAKLLGQTPFSYKAPLDPVQGLVGSHDLGADGHYWFIESRFNLIGFHQKSNGQIENQSIPIERDSSFPGEEFDELMQAVIVGSETEPMAGIFVDSTLVRGNSMSVVTWNPKSGKA